MYTLMAQVMLEEQWTEDEYSTYLGSLYEYARWDGYPDLGRVPPHYQGAPWR